ncbi:MAG: glycosyl transferase family 2, partial [Chloroflexi bacterium]|nr:glycosyl transferase family 2 [Chloroflexota bacterium]
MTPLLTLFTAPKPFVDPFTSLIQHNALRSWQALGEEVEIVVIGNEEGIAEATKEYAFTHRPDVKVNHLGTPLI